MFKIILSIFVFASSIASAIPIRYRRPLRPVKCERILVGDDLQQQVTDIAVELGEQLLIAEELKLDPTIASIKALQQKVAEARALFTTSAEQAATAIKELQLAADEARPEIRRAIQEAKYPNVNPPTVAEEPDAAPAPAEGSGPVSHMWGRQWPPNSNDKP